MHRIFPNAAKSIGIMDVADQGKLQVLQLREDANNISDGTLIFQLRTENYILCIGGFHVNYIKYPDC
ncbi:hypothetical protein [Mucilaginibacter auburnensis]|nr:hypothetical protein [Mucilaginibacter auburnensis]